MESLISIFNPKSPTPDPATFGAVGAVSGTYAASIGGTGYVLKLWVNGEGFVDGSFTADETLEVRGGFSPLMGSMQGFLLEPFGHMPVAMFSATTTPQGLWVQIGVPEFEGSPQCYGREQLLFSRVLEVVAASNTHLCPAHI